MSPAGAACGWAEGCGAGSLSLRGARCFGSRRDGGSSVGVGGGCAHGKAALGLADAVVGLNHPDVIFFLSFPSLVRCRTGAAGPAPALAGEGGSAARFVRTGEKRERRGRCHRQTGDAGSPPAAQHRCQSPRGTQPYVSTPGQRRRSSPKPAPRQGVGGEGLLRHRLYWGTTILDAATVVALGSGVWWW